VSAHRLSTIRNADLILMMNRPDCRTGHPSRAGSRRRAAMRSSIHSQFAGRTAQSVSLAS